MQYGVMRDGWDPKGKRTTPVRIAGHFVARVGRPSRFRGRGLMIILAVFGIVLVVLGRRNYVNTLPVLHQWLTDRWCSSRSREQLQH